LCEEKVLCILKKAKEELSSTTLLWIYFLVSLGIALQVGAANWDIIWHGIVNVESFFTPPHTVLYSGVGLSLVSTVAGIILSIKYSSRSTGSILSIHHRISTPLKLIILGTLVEVFSGGFDNWWHSHFGFDGLLSPPHLMLISGMLMSIIGGLIGTHLSGTKTKFKVASELIAFGILWMVLVNFVFMFTLPFSEGQYFNFNPSPTAALVLGSIMPAVFTAIVFYCVQGISFPFQMTTVTATLMVLQSSSTIVSNVYFAGLFPLYLLNILVPLALDIIATYTKNNNKILAFSPSKDLLRILFSIAISFSFITLYFPWSVNMFKSYFGIDLITFESVAIFEQLFWKFIIPILMPISFASAYLGVLIWKKFYAWSRLTNAFRVVIK
jgi:hypothetical protein